MASRGASLAVVIAGGLVLVGWALNVAWLKSLIPGLVAMNPVTALTFILAGIALRLSMAHHSFRSRVAARGIGIAVAAVGTLKLAEYLFGWQTGIDRVLFENRLGAVGIFPPNRMAPNTALNFALLGSALFLLDIETPRGYRPAQTLTLVAACSSLLALIGYAYSVTPLYTMPSFIPMALNTALAFTILATGVLFARPDRGIMAAALTDHLGGIAIRRIVPAVVGILPVLGWMFLQGQRAGFFGVDFGAALMVVVSGAIFVTLIWATSATLNRADIDREESAQERDRYFQFSLDMLCIAGFDGYFKRLNPQWQSTTGWTPQELMSKPYLEFVHPDDRAATINEAGTLSDGRPTVSFENRYVCRDGSYKWFQWKAAPLPEGHIIYAAARDVSERKKMDEDMNRLNADLQAQTIRLDAANKELEAFCYSVSHDLRAPLRGIDGFSRALLEDYADRLDAEGKSYLERVRAASRRMAQLIDDLLNLSRVTRGEIHREPVDLSAIARAVAAELQAEHPQRHVDVVVADGLRTEGDPRLLKIVMDNLLGNAWKYTGKHPRAAIEVGVASRNGRTTYFVRDDGAGFDMAGADKLFGAFQRLHGAAEFPGTGIGLATVQRIVTRHGGRVWAEGAVERGATVYFTL
ncbi:MAG: ATP-binding protein [Nitrospiria bacterium]